MPYDFSAKQVKSGKLIASGGLLANKHVGLMIYSASDSTNKQGGIPAAMTAGVGSDVFLFVSGAKDGKQSGYGRVTLFGGDLAVSGTLYAEKMIVEINEITTGSLFVSGGLAVSQSVEIEGYKKVTNGKDGNLDQVSLHFSSESGQDHKGKIVWDDFDAQMWESGQNLYLSASNDVYMYIGGGGGNSDLIVSGVGHTAVQIVSDSSRDGNAVVKFNVADSTAFALGVDDGDSDKFKIHPGAIDNASTFVIDSDSNIGIGTASPNRKVEISDSNGNQLRLNHTTNSKFIDISANNAGDLEITGSSNSGHLRFITPGGNSTVIVQTNAGDDGDAQVAFSVDAGASIPFSMGIDDSDADKFKIGTSVISTATRLTIDSSGNVGIGVTDPDELLEVAGDVKVSGANKLYFYDSGGEYLSSDGGDLTIAAGTAINIETATMDLSAQTVDITLNNAADAINFDSNTLSIDASNNRVGIGTNAPSNLLTVAGDANVTGDLTVSDDVYALSDLNVSGSTTLAGDTVLTGDLTVSDDIYGLSAVNVSGSLSVANDTWIADKLNVSGSSAFSGAVLIGGGFGSTGVTITSAGNISADGALSADEGIRVGNNALTASDGGTPIIWDTSDNVTIAGDLTVTGNDIKGASGTAITFSGVNTFLAGDLKIIGNDIQSSDGLIAISLSKTDVITGGGIKVTNNAITASDGGIPIVWDTSDNVTVAGDLTINGNDIKKSGGGTAITMLGSGITIAGDLKIDGNDILSNSGLAAITLSKTDVTSLGGIKVTNNALTASDGGTPIVWDTGDNVTIAGDLTSNEEIYAIAGLNVSGSSTLAGALAASGSVAVSEYIKHIGDPNTFIRFQTDAVTIDAGGVTYLRADAGDAAFSINPDDQSIDTVVYSSNKLAIAVKASTDQILILSGGNASSVDEAAVDDVGFYVSGSVGSHGTSVRGTSLFGGDVVMSGSAYGGSIIPLLHNTYDLGSNAVRWANVYTGDLHLQNEKGNWTIQEDSDKLIVINNLTGKRYKMALEPLEDNE